jgi:hypothetical protein
MRLYKYNKKTFQLLDYEEFYGDLKAANQEGFIKFQKAYSFVDEYRVRDISPESLYHVYNSFKSNTTLFNNYVKFSNSLYSYRDCVNDCRNNKINAIILKN